MDTNKKYKSSVFSLFFNDSEKLIELYNAIENAHYAKDTPVEINTLEDALFLDRLNDISFLLDGKLIVLIEHQSTLNENMPLRLLLYIGRVYEKLLDGKNIYRQKLLKIPKPDFIVLYNGAREFPDQSLLKLSDAFEDADIPALLDLTVKVYNINNDRNPGILQKSGALKDYAAFIARVKANKAAGMALEAAIENAIKYCIENSIMREFLKKHGSEVHNMLFTEFNIDDAKLIWQEEAREDGVEEGIQKGIQKGRKEGRKEGLEEGIKKGVADSALKMLRKGMTPQAVADYLDLPIEKVRTLARH
jgi:predicted transposase/invertase (TIGR01784 family)